MLRAKTPPSIPLDKKPAPPNNLPPGSTITETEVASLPPLRCNDLTPEVVQRMTGRKPMNMTHYDIALTHPDAGLEYDYEKYEFLGDSVLSFVTAKFLYEKHSAKGEGYMTVTRSKLTRADQLALFSEQLELQHYVKMSAASIQNGMHKSKKVLEDVFESLVCAVYHDLGMLAVKSFILDVYDTMVDWDELAKNKNYKEQLMQYQHKKQAELPTYVSVRDDETKLFKVSIDLDGHRGIGKDRVKKRAEQAAARDLLMKFGEHVDA